MGANESRPGAHHESRPNDSNPNHVNPDNTEDLYEILQVGVDATPEEIKKAFRKQALIHHPDKNYENVEIATKRFAKIQQAYEVLSDEDERAFYDRHRDDLLNGANDDYPDFEPTNLNSTKTSYSSRSLNPGLTTKHILKFFDASLWKGDFTDADTSFYTIYRSLFNKISSEEMIAREDSTIIYPSFGTTETNYDQDVGGERALKYFYSTWSNFATQKTFEWIEPHQASTHADRRYKRLVDKENQRARDAAKREYNETIRSLVAFIKKRDPRFAKSTASNPEKWRAQEIQRIKRELREVAEKRAKEREDEARQFREQEWQMQQDASAGPSSESDALDNSGVSDEDSDAEDEEEEEEIVNDWHCPACNKDFNSQGAWDNHERSKKHKQNCLQLRKQLLKEESDLQSAATASPMPRQLSHVSTELETDLDDKLVLDDTSDTSQVRNELATDAAPDAKQRERTCSHTGTTSPTSPRALSPNRHQTDHTLPSPPIADSSTRNSSLHNQHDPDLLLHQDVSSDAESEVVGMARRKGKKARRAQARNMILEEPTVNDDTGDRRILVSIIGDDPLPIGPSQDNSQTDVKTELSKREKRRAKELAKKQNAANAESGPKSEACNYCHTSFASKTKLFEHIKRTGHALAPNTPASSRLNQSINSRSGRQKNKQRGKE